MTVCQPSSPRLAVPARLLAWMTILASIWLPVVYLLGAQWTVYPEYQYGWAVPLLCGYLAWQTLQSRAEQGARSKQSGEQKTEVRRSPSVVRRLFSNLPLPSSLFYLLSSIFYLLLVLSALVYWIMRILQEANPLWRLASWGLAVSAVSMTLCVLRLAFGGGGQTAVGGEQASVIRPPISVFVFPVCFFLVAVPWPTPMESAVIQTLTRLNATIAAEVMGLVGVPALVHGNVIETSAGMVGIDEACSGIRSLQATLMISLFFGEFYRLSWPRRGWLLLAGPLLAMVFNLLRTCVLVFVAAKAGLPTMEHWHDTTGVALLLGCFFSLWGMAAGSGANQKSEVRNRKSENTDQKMGSAPLPGAVSGPTGENLPTPLSSLLAPQFELCRAREVKFLFHRAAFQNFSVLRLALGLLIWSIAVAVSTEFWFRLHESKAVVSTWSVRWPEENASFQTNSIPQFALNELQCDRHSAATWTSADGTFWQGFYLRWLPASSFYGRTRVALSKSHNPSICLPAAGMVLKARLDEVSLPVSSRETLPFERFIFNAGGREVYVFFSQTEAVLGGAQASARMTHWSRLQAALQGSRNFGQINFEVALTGPQDADGALQLFSAQLPGLVRNKQAEDSSQ